MKGQAAMGDPAAPLYVGAPPPITDFITPTPAPVAQPATPAVALPGDTSADGVVQQIMQTAGPGQPAWGTLPGDNPTATPAFDPTTTPQPGFQPQAPAPEPARKTHETILSRIFPGRDGGGK